MKSTKLAVLAVLSLVAIVPTVQAQRHRDGCPRSTFSDDYGEPLVGAIVSGTQVKSCLNSINELENWKSFWGVDENYPLFLVSLKDANTGGDREITMLIRDIKVSAHWSTLAGMGYVDPVSGKTPVYVDRGLVRPIYSEDATGAVTAKVEVPASVFLNRLSKAAKEFQLCPEEYTKGPVEGDSRHNGSEAQEKCKGSRYEDRWAFAADFVKAAKTEVDREEAALKIQKQTAELEYQKALQEIRNKTKLDKMSLPEKETLNKTLDEKKSAAESAGSEPDELRENWQNIYKVKSLLGALRQVDKKYTKFLGQKLGAKPVAREDAKLFPNATIDYDGWIQSRP